MTFIGRESILVDIDISMSGTSVTVVISNNSILEAQGG